MIKTTILVLILSIVAAILLFKLVINVKCEKCHLDCTWTATPINLLSTAVFLLLTADIEKEPVRDLEDIQL